MTQQPKQMNISIDKTTPVVCEECKSQTFVEALMLRKVSKFLTGQTQDSLMPIQVFVCANCGHTNDDMLPPQLVEQLNKESDGQNGL